MAKIRLTKYGPFVKGMNNVRRSQELGMDELVNAVNVDLDATGRVSRRPGLTKLLALGDSHSFWTSGERAFFVSGTELRELTYDGATFGSYVLRSDLTAGQACAFLQTPDGLVYYGNGIQSGRITAASALRAWGVEHPAAAPALAVGGGILPPGRYQVAVTFVDDQGEESGASTVSAIDLAATGGITVTLPAPTDANVAAVAVYCTPTNGEAFLHSHVLAVPTPATTTIGAIPTGHELATLNMAPLPPGELLAYHGGRIYAASSNVVWYSEPYRLGLARLGRNFVPLPDQVTCLAPVDDGIWLSTAAQTYWMPGGSPLEATLAEPLPYGAIRGTSFSLPDMNGVGWFSHRGVVVCLSGGQVKNQTDGRIILQPYLSGSTVYRERDGVRQFIGSMKDSGAPNDLRVTDYAEAELRRQQ